MARDGSSGDTVARPESLLQWLSQQYVSGADLQAALASLELSILQNISLQLEQHHGEETVREAVLHADGAAVTEEVMEHRFRCSSSLSRRMFTDLSLSGCPRDREGRSADLFSGPDRPRRLRSGVWRY